MNMFSVIQKTIDPSFLGGQQSFQKSLGMAPPVTDMKSMTVDPFSYQSQYGYRDKPSRLTFNNMRLMAEKNIIVAAIIQTRLNQVAAFAQIQPDDYSMGFKVRMRDRNKEPTLEQQEEMRELEDFVLITGSEYNEDRDDFETFVRKFVWDSLVFDQGCFETLEDYEGRPAEFHAVDASTIRMAAYLDPKEAEEDEEADELIAYIQVINGRIETEYTSSELAFCVRNARTDIMTGNYGKPELEMIVNQVTSHLWAEEYNRKYFMQGSAPKGIINIKGNIQQEQLDAFKRQWLAQISGVTNSWRTPVLNSPDDIQFIPFNNTSRDMEYSAWVEYLIKTMCGVFQIDPAEINFDIKGGAAPALIEKSNVSKETMSKDKGLKPILRFLAKCINKKLIWRYSRDYIFEFVGLEADTPEEAQDKDIKAMQNYKTVDETRVKNNLPPIGGTIGKMIANPVIAQAMMQEQAMQQQAQGQPQGGQPPEGEGGEGEPEEFTDEDVADMQQKARSDMGKSSNYLALLV